MVVLLAQLAAAAPGGEPCPCTRQRSFEEVLAEHTVVAATLGPIERRGAAQRVVVEVEGFLLGDEVPLPLTVWGDDDLGCRAAFPDELAGREVWLSIVNEGISWGLPRCGVGVVPAPVGEEREKLERRLALYERGREGQLAWNFDRYASGRMSERVLAEMSGRDDAAARDFWRLLLARRAVDPAHTELVAAELARTADFEAIAELATELVRPQYSDHEQALVAVAALAMEGSGAARDLLEALAWDARLHRDVRLRAFRAVASPTAHRALERVLVTGDAVLLPQVLDWLEAAPQPVLLEPFLASALTWSPKHERIIAGYAGLDAPTLQGAARRADDRGRLSGQLLPLAAGQLLAAEGDTERALPLLRTATEGEDEDARRQAIWEIGVAASRSGLSDEARAAFEALERMGRAALCPIGVYPGSCSKPLAAHDAARPYALDQRSGFALEYTLGEVDGCTLTVHPRIASGPERKWVLSAPLPGSPASTLSFQLIRSDGSVVVEDTAPHRVLPKLWLPERVLDFDPATFEADCEEARGALLVRATMTMRGPAEEWGSLELERWLRAE